MFDPTIYDNLKVVLEGAVYDLDLNRRAVVTARADTVDLADMSREFRIVWRRSSGLTEATAALRAEMGDLAAEIGGDERPDIGCRLTIRFARAAQGDGSEMAECIRGLLDELWAGRPRISQRVIRRFEPNSGDGGREEELRLETTLDFGRKIGEAHVDDLPALIELVMRSLEEFDRLH